MMMMIIPSLVLSTYKALAAILLCPYNVKARHGHCHFLQMTKITLKALSDFA